MLSDGTRRGPGTCEKARCLDLARPAVTPALSKLPGRVIDLTGFGLHHRFLPPRVPRVWIEPVVAAGECGQRAAQHWRSPGAVAGRMPAGVV
jgi:hypothetical protein